MNLLLHNIQKIVFLTEEEQQIVLSRFEEKTANKRELLLREGEICRGLIFVTEGVLRTYSTDKNGFEHVLQFAPNSWWVSDIYSFKTGNPARLFIDALEYTEYVWIQKNNLEYLYEKIPTLEKFFRIRAENALIAHQNRLISFLSLPAIERYKNFCDQYPSLIDFLPQKQVASYIGVTPEFLSKMLKEKF